MKEHFHSVLVGLLLATMVAGVGYWFFTHYELKPHEEQLGAQGEAARNSLFYARLFLKRMGIPTETKHTLTIPDTQTVIVLDSERYVLSQDKIQALLNWVEQGGHLVTRLRNKQTAKTPPKESTANTNAEETKESTTSTPTEVPADDKFEDEIDTSTSTQPEPTQENAKSSQAHDLLQEVLDIKGGMQQSIPADDLPLHAKLPNNDKDLSVDFDLFRAIKSTSHAWAIDSPKGDYWVVHKVHGKGAVTLVSDLSFADNSALGNEDNAEFFWSLLHTQYTPEQVWLVHDQEYPSLLELMWEYGWLVMLSFGALLLLIAWAWMPRFGALVPLPAPSRRRITEHLQAAGRFQWFQQPQGREQMVDFLRQDTLQRAQKQLTQWLQLNEGERLSTMGKPLQLDLAAIQYLFQAPQLKEAEFIKLTQLNHYWRHCTTC